MVYSYNEAKIAFGSNYQIHKKLRNKELYKITEGIYSDKELVDPIVITCKAHPNSIITMDTAFYYYDLTDVVPKTTHIATQMHSYVIPSEDITQYFVNNDFLNIGKIEVVIDGEKVSIYDRERLLIELVKRKNQISFDYYKEIINNYRNISHELQVTKIEKYLSYFPNENKLFNLIQSEVF